MTPIRATTITIPPARMRKVFNEDALLALARDIEDKGLLQPIGLRDDRTTLIYGERRLRACLDLIAREKPIKYEGRPLSPGLVPCLLQSELSEYQLREAELTENICREQLTWQERVQAIDALHKFRLESNPSQTYVETGREVMGDGTKSSNASATVSTATILAKHLPSNPAVAGAKNEREALRILARDHDNFFKTELARRRAGTSELADHILIEGEFSASLAIPHAGSFACIIADPPYGIGADSVFGDASRLSHSYDDSPEAAEKFCVELLRRASALAAPKAHLYIFCDARYFGRLHTLCSQADWWPINAPIIWYKGGSGLAPYPNHFPRRTYECILLAIKNEKPANSLVNDLIEIPQVRDKDHAAQKPVDLYHELLKRSTRPGDRVLDPCCGTGPIFPAATRAKCLAVGVEKDPATYQLALARFGE